MWLMYDCVIVTSNPNPRSKIENKSKGKWKGKLKEIWVQDLQIWHFSLLFYFLFSDDSS